MQELDLVKFLEDLKLEVEKIREILLENEFVETKYLFYNNIEAVIFNFHFYYIKNENRFYITIRELTNNKFIHEERVMQENFIKTFQRLKNEC